MLAPSIQVGTQGPATSLCHSAKPTWKPKCFSEVEGRETQDSPPPGPLTSRDNEFFRSCNISAVLATEATRRLDVILSQRGVRSGQLLSCDLVCGEWHKRQAG